MIVSAEVKAIETGELLGVGPVTIDARVGEVTKPWYDDFGEHQAATRRYLEGATVPGWEPQGEACARFEAAIEAALTDGGVLVTHGTVMTLWLGRHIPGFDSFEFWSNLAMPDAYLFDRNGSTLERLAVGQRSS